jgi:hypothetical protein
VNREASAPLALPKRLVAGEKRSLWWLKEIRSLKYSIAYADSWRHNLARCWRPSYWWTATTCGMVARLTAADFLSDPVALGRAGKRSFWAPCVLKIDGKNYIPFFDPRRQNGLTCSQSITPTFASSIRPNRAMSGLSFFSLRIQGRAHARRSRILIMGSSFGPIQKSAG